MWGLGDPCVPMPGVPSLLTLEPALETKLDWMKFIFGATSVSASSHTSHLPGVSFPALLPPLMHLLPRPGVGAQPHARGCASTALCCAPLWPGFSTHHISGVSVLFLEKAGE